MENGIKTKSITPVKKRRMSDARKINRREHRYRKRDLERIFTGKSSKNRIEDEKAKAIASAKAKKALEAEQIVA